MKIPLDTLIVKEIENLYDTAGYELLFMYFTKNHSSLQEYTVLYLQNIQGKYSDDHFDHFGSSSCLKNGQVSKNTLFYVYKISDENIQLIIWITLVVF